ncbi:MAG: DUF4097 domain-containing protein [candidate division Zixibacteria bacterium]|nr:DUF4097 domain-containing protein [candidate division Zixibacteria bacterium]
MKKRQILNTSFLLIFVFVLIFPPIASAEEYTFTLHKELPATASPSLKVQNTSGEIKIESHPENKIIIDALKVVEADNSEEAKRKTDGIEVVIENYDSKVEIKTKYTPLKSKSFWEAVLGFDGKSSGYVDYHILVPEKIELNVSSISGDVIISDISGGVEVNVTSGDLWIKRIKGHLDLETTSGDVEISMIEGGVIASGTSSNLEMFDIKGDANLSSTSGDISAEDIAGSIQINNTSGDVSLKEVEGNIEVTTASGDVIIDQKEGGLRLESSSGDVEVKTKIFPQYKYYVETSSGYIRLLLPQDSNAEVELETSSGSLDCKLPLTVSSISRNLLKGKLGEGGPQINLITTSGDISLGEYTR